MMYKILFLLLALLPCGVKAEEAAVSKAQAATLGVVQGIMEFLPVSSTGHMILVNECCFKTSGHDHVQKSLEDYMVCIQLGTILTLLLFYRRDVIRILKGWFLGKDKIGFQLGLNVGVAFIPAGLLGFLLDGFIQTHFYNKTFIALSLFIGGAIILWLERFRAKHPGHIEDVYNLSLRSAIIIGLFQMIALWPGFSRSLATIMGGIIVGLTLIQAIKFSFLLGLLTSFVATVYKLLKHGSDIFQTIPMDTYLLGIVLAFIVGISTIALFLRFLQKNGLKIFGYYRLLIGVLLSFY